MHFFYWVIVMNDIWNVCFEESLISYQQGDVPVGAVVVRNGEIVAKSHNTREKEHKITGHAEINVILSACELLKRWNLGDCELYVTLKPCSMCAEVIKQARILNVYYLLDKLDYKKEFSKTSFNKIENEHVQKYAEILSSFFKEKR